MSKRFLKGNCPNHVAVVLSAKSTKSSKISDLESLELFPKISTIRTLIEIVCVFEKIKVLSIALSHERDHQNQKISEHDIVLFLEHWRAEKELLEKCSVRIKFLGNFSPLNNSVRDLIRSLEILTEKNDRLTLHFAINYGGRQSLIRSLKSHISVKTDRGEALNNKQSIADCLSDKIPDVDLLILTSNNQCVCDFMLWQIFYAEIVFSKTHWKDFEKKDFCEAIDRYQRRSRRFGKVPTLTKNP